MTSVNIYFKDDRRSPERLLSDIPRDQAKRFCGLPTTKGIDWFCGFEEEDNGDRQPCSDPVLLESLLSIFKSMETGK